MAPITLLRKNHGLLLHRRCAELIKAGFHKSAQALDSRCLSTVAALKEDVPVPGVSYKDMTIGVPKEIFTNEKRVALTPQVGISCLILPYSR